MNIFFFNDTATTEIYTLSLHDALPISVTFNTPHGWPGSQFAIARSLGDLIDGAPAGSTIRMVTYSFTDQDTIDRLLRSEEHTPELQSRQYLVCRLLLEKKKTNPTM